MDELAPTQCEARTGNRSIELRFTNDEGRTLEVWRREGDTTGWELIATTERRRYVDRPTKPGQYYEYRTRAKKGETVSDFSPSTVIYGK